MHEDKNNEKPLVPNGILIGFISFCLAASFAMAKYINDNVPKYGPPPVPFDEKITNAGANTSEAAVGRAGAIKSTAEVESTTAEVRRDGNR